MPRCFPALIACLLALFTALPASADTADKLVFKAPASFTDLTSQENELFQETASQAVAHGRLLRLYLPDSMAHQYRSGNRDAVTREVLVCALKDQRTPFDQKDMDLLARSTEGLFIGFSRIPKNRTDTPAEELEHRKQTLKKAVQEGTPLLVDSLRTSRAYLYTCLVHYPMAEHGEKTFLTTALATALVPVRGTALFVTVSSILGRGDAEVHLEWVKETATAFAAMIHDLNKEEKTP